MSMTREEAIEYAESKKMRLEALVYSDDCKYGNYAMYSGELSFVNAALTALRPVSREQVERIWFREPYTRPETKCGENGGVVYSAVNTCMACGHETPIGNFCHNCGAAQTREAVEMVMEKINNMEEMTNEH